MRGVPRVCEVVIELYRTYIKKSKSISGEAYIQSSNANAHVLLTFQFFGWFQLFLAPTNLRTSSDNQAPRNSHKIHTYVERKANKQLKQPIKETKKQSLERQRETAFLIKRER